ncbi:protein of unknown function [Nitrospira japonica]|uniref:Uncharacterized protein n=1 Tax=Nitrospira japonica TaxID=1325564 RepID=A0A1W1I8W6_9BACT|nr:protein of unknown function [Nitrospira japonica]
MISSRKHVCTVLAGFVVLLYVALAGLSTGCLFTHTVSNVGHNHHKQNSSHSTLCAWYCQATSHAALISQPPSVTAKTVGFQELLPRTIITSVRQTERIHPRGPPLQPST